MARDPATCNFFSKAVLGLADGGTGNNRPAERRTAGALAAGVILKSGKGAWFWKVAYDETLSQTSPGVQLTLDLTEEMARDHDIAFIDSCAVPDHPMIDHFGASAVRSRTG